MTTTTITLPPKGEPAPLPVRPEGQRERQIDALRAEIAKLESGAGMLPAWARENRIAGMKEELGWLLHDVAMTEQAENAFADEEPAPVCSACGMEHDKCQCAAELCHEEETAAE